jgi:hypothetical protein
MAACRLLNLLLGASTLAIAAPSAAPVFTAASGLFVYILGVTWFSRSEAGSCKSERTCRLGSPLCCWDCWWMVIVCTRYAAGLAMLRGSGMGLLLLGLNLSMRAAAAMSAARPQSIQQTVGLMLLSLIFRDAMIVFRCYRERAAGTGGDRSVDSRLASQTHHTAQLMHDDCRESRGKFNFLGWSAVA